MLQDFDVASLQRSKLATNLRSWPVISMTLPLSRQGEHSTQVNNLPMSVDALTVWRRYNSRANLENRINELGGQFGIKRLGVENLWDPEALHHLAIAAYNLCALLQRRLGQLEKCELNSLRWRLFGRAAAWSRAGGKPTLKQAVHGPANRNWWREKLSKLTAQPNCHAVASLQA